MRILLENVQKSYGRRPIVRRVNLAVAQGEIIGLLGPNGAGKTTTFYMATGLERPDEGKVWLDDEDITPLSMTLRARRGIGYLAQEASIFRFLTIEDNLRLVLQQSNLDKTAQERRLQELLTEFRLHTVAHTQGIQVSGGSGGGRKLRGRWPPVPMGQSFCCWMSPLRGLIQFPWRRFRTLSSSCGARILAF